MNLSSSANANWDVEIGAVFVLETMNLVMKSVSVLIAKILFIRVLRRHGVISLLLTLALNS